MPSIRSSLTRPWPAALALAALAQALFSWRVTVPHMLVFDEVHYVPAARTIWSLAAPANVEHPPLGKLLIGLGIRVFGDDALGWRAMSTLAGTATVLGLFAIAWLLFGRIRAAVIAAVLAIVNFTLFIQARVAMLDGFMAALVVLAVAAMIWAMRGSGAAVARRWTLGAALLGLAAGVKWVAVPYIAFAGVGFLLARRGAPHRWPGLRPMPALLLLGGASATAYCLTFTPAFFYGFDPLTLRGFVPLQIRMFHEQTQVLPHHTYQSPWYTWPLVIRPIWYLYEPADGPAVRGILFLGNPAVMWGGVVAVAACLWAWARDRRVVLGGVAALWIGGWGMWALVPKSLGFLYYYYLPTLWLPLALAAAFDHYAKGRWRYWDETFVLLAVGLFLYFYPIIAATALPNPQAFRHWMWFSTWP